MAARGRLFGRNGFALALGGAFAGLFGLAAALTAIDPYDLYPWGARIPLKPERYSHVASLWILGAVSRGGYETVLIGGSSAEQLEGEDIQRILPEAGRAIDVLYPGPRARDLAIVADRVGRSPDLRRLIVSFDSSWLFGAEDAHPNFPFALYDGSPLNDLRAMRPESLTLAARLVTGRPFELQAWRRERVWAVLDEGNRQAQTVERAAIYRRIIAETREGVDDPTRLTCADLDALPKLFRIVDGLAKRGVKVDVVIPPYSYLSYYDFRRPERQFQTRDQPALATLILARRCLVETVGATPGVRVFAFDLEAAMVEDMANYRDGTHLHGPRWGRWMLTEMAADRGRLTPTNFDAYAAELRRRVVAWHYRNSNLP